MLTVVFNVVPAKAALYTPLHIHLTWQTETSTTMTVTWQTNLSTSGDTVLFDSISCDGNASLYTYGATGINFTYSGASGYIHEVELTDLTPDSVYYFICGGDIGGWSSERAFRTAPSTSSNVRFVVGGDSRTNAEKRTEISKAMAKFNPSFVMHSGDMVADGSLQGQWDSWFTDLNNNWIGENNLTIPIIPVLGNHENPNFPDTKYFVQFALPSDERWYSYNWGPDIHIICLDSESYASGDQLDWLQNDLATHAKYKWKFVLFHKPPFVSGSHLPWSDGLTYWVPLFDKYHVDIVFNGHEHNYQRTYPLNWTASQNKPQDYSNGTMYLVSGGWGAPLYNPRPIWYMAYQIKAYHFCLVDVFKNGTLHLQTKDNQGNTFDEVIIHKPPLPDTTPPTISIVSPENKTYSGKDIPLTFSVSEPASWIGYSLDAQANVTITGNITLQDVPDGSHHLIVYANDTSSNMGASCIVYFDAYTLFGDINHDCRIDMRDIATAAAATGSFPTHPRWNNEADMNQDNRVDMKDLIIIASHFGESDP